jgi:hypothetical protein
MSDYLHRYKREIIEEILTRDKNFFAANNLEFNIFKYTSLFAVFTFTLQVAILVIQNLYGVAYFTIPQVLFAFLSIAGFIFLIQLYLGLTSVIRKSTNKKGSFIKYYKCEKCDYDSFSSTDSTIHIISHTDHSFIGKLVLVKSFSQKLYSTSLNKILHSLGVHKEDAQDSVFITSTESDVRIKDKMERTNFFTKKTILSLLIIILIVISYTSYLYFQFKSLTLVIIVPIMFFGLTQYGVQLITRETSKDENHKIYLLLIEIKGLNKLESLKVRFELFSVGRLYWEYVKKNGIEGPIDTLNGPLYIVNKLITNKFAELIEVNSD